MRVIDVLSLLSCGLLREAHGFIDMAPKLVEDDSFLKGRNLVQTPRGLWIENHYIALGESQSVCDSLIGKIEEWKLQNLPNLRGNFNDDPEELSALSIHVTCYLPFTGPEELISFVRSQEGVIDVDFDVVVNATELNPPSWGLNRIDQPDLPLSTNVAFDPEFTGKGVNVYVIDTGVRADHGQFSYRRKRRASVPHNEISNEKATDLNGHGTHCAGTVGGSTFGIAKSATIYGVKVLSSSGSGSTTGVISGVKWAVANQKTKHKGRPAVLSLSLGGGKNAAMNAAVEDAAKAGNIVVVAAGNDGDSSCNHSPASAGGKGREGGVISVGATTITDQRAVYSNYGNCVDIFAPGSAITSAWIRSTSDYRTLSGTSMATPHVAGVAAVLLEKNRMNRDAAQAEIFSLAVQGRVLESKSKNRNLLLQVPSRT